MHEKFLNWITNDFLGPWPGWWKALPLWKKITPTLLALAYWAILFQLNGLRSDLFVSSLLPVVLYYLGPGFHPIFEFTLPLFLTSIIYDSQRYYADYIRGPIHVVEPYEFDKKFFGINSNGIILTPNEWWQLNTVKFLDFICGIAYIIFIPVFMLCAAYWRFFASRAGTKLRHPRSILLRSPQVMWAFFWVNMIGYSTYYWYAASPPWYVALYGLGPARLDVPANVAGCARFDELLGIPVFKNWYGHSADVHGAIPSLHIAYPLQAVYYAFRFGVLRKFTVFFYLLMCFSAVYLNHHYILDLIWGSVYAIAVCLSIDAYWNWDFKRKNIIVPGEDSVIASGAKQSR
jgi:inositol phosphorylceramide synthase catalytic subunit